MCGIAGSIINANLSSLKVSKLLNLMKNRGPDNQSYRKFEFSKKNLYFFSSRLKIVDRHDRSNQPMTFGNITIIFNGEIYNHVELRKKILKKKFNLKTRSDTEIILRLYQVYGANCVKYLEGMWAFAIYDQTKKIIFISRDRIGEKPLYYCKKNGSFYFGSQTNFIRQLTSNNSINHNKIINYLAYGYKSIERGNDCFYENIFKLEPGTNLIINNNFEFKFDKFWQPKIFENSFSEKKTNNIISSNLDKSISKICKSNLNIGLSLSGGIDSNLLLSFIIKKLGKKNITTYSIIDNDPRYDESELINYSAKIYGVRNQKIILDPKENHFENLNKLIRYHDKPISTINYFLQSYIYKTMAKDNIKISISGNGADEMFAGYYQHYQLYYQTLKKNDLKVSFKKKWLENIYPLLRNNEFKNLNKKKIKSFFTFFNKKQFKKNFKRNLKEEFFISNVLKNKMANEFFYQTLPLALHEDDLNAMYYSIENRSPFLSKSLVEKCFSIKSKYFMKDAFNKYLLRKNSENILKDRIRLNREKKGFNASFDSVFSFNNNKFKDWFFEKNSPIFDLIKRDLFLKKFNKSKLKELNQQNLFNICSAKLFLEKK